MGGRAICACGARGRPTGEAGGRAVCVCEAPRGSPRWTRPTAASPPTRSPPTAELVELLRVHARASRATHGSLRGRVASFMRPVFVRA